MSEDKYKQLRLLTREHTARLWQAVRLGLPLKGEEATMAQAMLDHTEYWDVWDHLLEKGDEEILVDGVNPLVHVTVHSTIENQIAAGDPPCVRHALRRLLRQGMDRHEAIHRIGAVLATEIWEILKDNRPFDRAGYSRAIRRLGREEVPSAQPRKRIRKRR